MNSSTLGRRHTYFQLTILDLSIGNLYAIWLCHLMQRGSHCYPSVRRPQSVANISLRVSQVYGEQTACLIMMKGNVLKAGKTKKKEREQKGSAKGAFHCVWGDKAFIMHSLPWRGALQISCKWMDANCSGIMVKYEKYEIWMSKWMQMDGSVN